MSEVTVLEESEQALRKHGNDLRSEWDKPLKVDKNGFITSGVLFINGPFKTDFWSGRRKKPKPNKCICEHCGNKHATKHEGNQAA